MRAFFRESSGLLFHLGIVLAAVTFASALAAAGVPEIVALISAGIFAAAVIGWVNSRQIRQEQARVAEMPADEAQVYKARARRSALLWNTFVLFALAVIAVWAQTAKAFVLLGLYLAFTVWLFHALREREDR